jgi:alanine dehydrogenase
MNITLWKHRQPSENRVPLTPGAVGALVGAGHSVYVQAGVGERASLPDDHYARRGGTIVFSAEEACGRADLLLRVGAPALEELELVPTGATLMSFLHLAMVSGRYLDLLLGRRLTAVGYEIITNRHGERPVLASVAEIAGRLSVQIGAHYLQTTEGGRGILLGGTPGVAPANVLVLGAGVLGTCAASAALGLGARVQLLDVDIRRLRSAEYHLGPGLVTGIASPHGIAEGVRTTDLLIGAVLVPGGRAPLGVSAEMVSTMPRGAVIIDMAIDQGGCVATSRPTTLESPVYREKGVLHYCVPNLTSAVARTASYALSHALYPYVSHIATHGFAGAGADIARGTYTHEGVITNRALADLTGRPLKALEMREEDETAWLQPFLPGEDR